MHFRQHDSLNLAEQITTQKVLELHVVAIQLALTTLEETQPAQT